jgi:hypothetical protein
MTQLRQQMQADMVVRGLAPRTQRAYIDAVAAIARYYGRSPDQLSCDEIEQYLHHLIEERKRSWSTTNQAVFALRFLFHITLKQRSVSLAIPYRRIGSKQPHILSRDEQRDRLTPAPCSPENLTVLPGRQSNGIPGAARKTTRSAAQSQFLANPAILQLTIPITTAADGGSVQRRLSAAETSER